MDNRRFFAYLLLGLSIFLLFNSWQRQRELAAIQAREEAAKGEKAKQLRAEQLLTMRSKLAAEPAFELPAEPPRSKHILGSMDPAEGYSLVVCLDNRGAGIERIEIVERDKKGNLKYRSLQEKERRGYAGYLSIDFSKSQPVIQTVPPGSPAALAICKSNAGIKGVMAGDKILSWGSLEGEPSEYKWDQWVDSWRIGKQVELEIEREGAGKLTFEMELTEKPLDIVRSEDDYLAEQVPGNTPVLSCLTTLAKVDDLSIEDGESSILGLEPTLQGNWEARSIDVKDGMGVEFSISLKPFLKLAGLDNADLELVKQYRLRKRSEGALETTPEHWQFHVELTNMVRNLGEKEHKIAVRQEGVNGISLEGWWYPTKISPFFFNAAGARDVIVSDGFAPHTLYTTRAIVSHAINTPAQPESNLFGPADSTAKRSLNYIGLDTQSFSSAFLPSADTPSAMQGLHRGNAKVLNSVYRDGSKLSNYKQQACNIGFWFETEVESIAPRSEKKMNYTIFAGPKDPTLLSAYRLDEALEYGWDIFGFFAKRLGWILHFFYGIIGNFGLAIMMLTVLVRSCMFPVSRKMAINAQKMQSVQSHTAKLREAFKEDPRKMMAAQQMLMKKAGINQFAGCLPAMIQLPIVIGLYRCVSVDVGLRQQALIPGWDWCSNLAGPDMLVEWHKWMPDFIAGRGTGYFGPFFNILPIITVTLFIIQQKVLMPKATDEQTAIAQKMMMFMTVAMGVLFFRIPAGLCIYFITSSTWSLVERWLIKKYTPKGTNIELAENTANEIIQSVNKLGTATAQRSSGNQSNSDKPREKMTKPPETLADIFPKWFGKNDQNGNGGSGVGKGSSKPSTRPNPERKGRKPKPK